MKIQLETERVILREITMDDLSDVMALQNHTEVQTYLGEQFPQNESFIAHIIKAIWQREYRTIGYGRWAAIEKDTNKFMGWAGLKYLKEFDLVDIGYRFFPEYWGKGYATECSLALRDAAFERFELKKLWGMAWSENTASIRVFQKIGMEFVKSDFYDKANPDVSWYSMDTERYNELKQNKNG
jgi:[ribosomal protein S5]-alanine N-acetyltransferase